MLDAAEAPAQPSPAQHGSSASPHTSTHWRQAAVSRGPSAMIFSLVSQPDYLPTTNNPVSNLSTWLRLLLVTPYPRRSERIAMVSRCTDRSARAKQRARLTRIQVRPVTDDDIGLRVLRNAPAEITEAIDVVAIHGIGAHPDDSWCKNVGTKESPQWVNWLVEESMLPAVVPHARIMRYGYQSQWFGKGRCGRRCLRWHNDYCWPCGGGEP